MRFVLLVSVLSLGASLSGPAVATSPPAAPSPTEWKAWGGGWVRLEADGNLSCLSFDAANCAWENSVQDPKNVDPSYIQPLVCGVKHQAVWNGVNGYNDYDSQSHYKGTQHWCRSAYASLFVKQWDDYSMLGAKHWLAETPVGDLMCHSTDGTHCTPVSKGESAPPPTGVVHPLVCGAHHRRMLNGDDGYATAGSWCQMPKIDSRHVDLPVSSSDWNQQLGAWWKHWLQPAVVARVKMPKETSLTLRADAQFKQPIAYGEPLAHAPFGIEFGQRLRFHLGDAEGIEPPMWRRPSLDDGEVVVGFKVTGKMNGCFFGAKSRDARDGHFFASENLIGSTLGVFDDQKRPIHFESSVGSSDKLPTPVDWRADKGADFKIEELLILYARPVPAEGVLTGKKRLIAYESGCDQQ